MLYKVSLVVFIISCHEFDLLQPKTMSKTTYKGIYFDELNKYLSIYLIPIHKAK